MYRVRFSSELVFAAGHVVGTEYDDPDVFSRRHGAAAEDLDRFDRVEGWDWTRDLATDRNFYDVGVAYDRNSNITSVDDRVHGGFDVAYTSDGLDRFSRAEEGTLSGGSISSRTRNQQWTLEQTGNWELDKVDLNGDGDFVDSGELNDDRTHNVVNELTARDTDDNGSNNHTLSYNARGDMTSDGDDYTYKYDAFGRLKAVYAISGASLVAEYKYNGLGFRIGWHYDADADGTAENTADDPWYLFVYDERWRIVNTYRLADWSYSVSNPAASNSKERFVYHNAGLGGWGGSSYIDSVILRDRDMNTAWTAASDGTLEKRHYYCQNWRADVSAIIDSSGKMVEWVKYSAYGVPYSLPSGDTDSDLDWDATDSAAMTGSYDIRKDADLDGDVDAADVTHANSIKAGTGYQALGRGVLSSTGVENRKSYAGYEYDPTFKGAGRVLMHVRHRVYDAELGRWTRRDPRKIRDDNNQSEYVRSAALVLADAMGTAGTRICALGADCGDGGGGDTPITPPRKSPPPGVIMPPSQLPIPPACSNSTTDYNSCITCCASTVIFNPGLPEWWLEACRRSCSFDDIPPENRPGIRESCKKFIPWIIDYGIDCHSAQLWWLGETGNMDLLPTIALCRRVADDASLACPPPIKNTSRHCVFACCMTRAGVDAGELNDLLQLHECCAFYRGDNRWEDYLRDWEANNLGILCANEGQDCLACCPACP